MKKHILFLFDYLEFGGGTRALINMARALSKEHHIVVIAGVSDEYGSAEVLSELQKECRRVHTYRVSFNASEIEILKQITFGVHQTLSQHVDLSSYDAVCINLTRSGIPLLFQRNRARGKVITIFHGAILLERLSQYSQAQIKAWSLLGRTRFWLLNTFLNHMQKMLISTSDEVLCYSQYSKDVLKSHLNSRSVHLIAPPAGSINRELTHTRASFGMRDDAVVVLINSRIEPRKGIHLAIEAAERICKKYGNVFFYVVGPSYHSDYFHQVFLSLRTKNLTGRFVFLGSTPHSTLLQLIQLADLTLMPSIQYETFGFSTVESLLLGVPVIGFDSGATPEILRKIESHLLAEELSADAIAHRIEWFISLSDKQKHQLKEKARQVVTATYNDHVFAEEFLKIIG